MTFKDVTHFTVKNDQHKGDKNVITDISYDKKKKQARRDRNIVADGWAGALNSHPHISDITPPPHIGTTGAS